MAGKHIDLHTHTLASDGTDTPAKMMRKAGHLGLAAVAVTDHDTLDGLDEAEEEALRVGIEFIRGIEIAVQDDEGELHLLGLWMPAPSTAMQRALTLFQKKRQLRNQAMLDSLAGMGLPLSMEEVLAFSGRKLTGRAHIARAMKKRGYVQSGGEAFKHYIGTSGKAFVPRSLLSPKEGIRLLRDEGATVALAHPCLSSCMTGPRLDDVLSDFCAWGLDALEVYHSAHSPGQTRQLLNAAARHSLLLTGGSDYHGLNKQHAMLGAVNASSRVPYVLLEKLKEFRRGKGLWI